MTDSNFIFLVVSAVGLMITFALGVILFFSIAQKKIQAEKLNAQQLKIDFQRNLLEKTIETQEEERTRIARELHDDIGSKLNVIHLNLHLLKSNMIKGEDVKAQLSDIQVALQGSIESSRQISHELIPPTLQKFGLQSAIEDLKYTVNQTGNIKFETTNNVSWELKEKIKELHLYRIIQEMTQNTLKHAFAKQILITFSKEDEVLDIVYEDDGIGFPKQIESKGLGMENLSARVQLLNGFWSIDEAVTSGARIKISIPL